MADWPIEGDQRDPAPISPWSDWIFVAFRIVGVYLVFGFTWILFSDAVLERIATSPQQFAQWQTYKGWLFVALTAFGLQWLVHRQVERLASSREQLRQSEERHRTLFAKIPWPVFIYDAHSLRFLQVNEAATTRFGYSSEQFAQLSLIDLVPVESRDTLLRAAASYDENGSRTIVTLRLKHGGASVEVELNARPLFWQGRRCILALAVDLSERRELEAQLQQAQKMEAVGLLAGGIAHDFNNMLGVILGYTQMLLETETDTEKKSFLSEISEAATKAAVVTKQLLAFSRKQVLEMQTVDLNELVNANEKLLQKLLGEHIEVRTQLCPTLLKTKADPHQLVQVLMNLAVNARDAMPTGGKLILRTDNYVVTEKDLQAHPYLKTGVFASLTVQDTGHGIDEPTQRRIFEPFFTTKEKGRGTGLGLSTVYGIVKQCDGFIWVESSPGAGAKFTVALPPQVMRGNTAQPAPAVTPALGGSGETILLVEDEPALRRITAAALRSAGYVVIEAQNGEDALGCFAANPQIALLLTDIVMPRLGGVALLKNLRALRPSLPALFVSGYPEDFALTDTTMDSSVLLLKPFQRDVLLARVQELLKLGRS